MATILDIVASTIIGGLILIMALNLMDTTNQYFYGQNDDLIVQQNLTSLTEILEFDLRKMGLGVPEGTTTILAADSVQLKYLGDIDSNWVLDTLEYFLGSYSQVSHTKNPNDRYLYRRINNTPPGGYIAGTVTQFSFNYLDQDGALVDVSSPANYSAIKMIRITMQVESPDVYSADPDPNALEYRRAFWQQTRLVSRNLRR